MLPNGNYIREEGGEGTSSQEALYHYFSSFHVSSDEEGESSDINPESLPESLEEKPETFLEPEERLEPEAPAEPEIPIVTETPMKSVTSVQAEEATTEAVPVQSSYYVPAQDEKSEIPQKRSIFRKIINLFFG